MSDIDTAPVFEGLHKLIVNENVNVSTGVEISDDLEEEQLALQAEHSTGDISHELMSSVHAVSRGVSEETHASYKRSVVHLFRSTLLYRLKAYVVMS